MNRPAGFYQRWIEFHQGVVTLLTLKNALFPFSKRFFKLNFIAACIYSYFEKGCRKKVLSTIPKGNMGYDQYTVPVTVVVELTLLLSFINRRHKSMASRAIPAHFFEEQWTQNHPQYLSGLSHVLPTSFLEIKRNLHPYVGRSRNPCRFYLVFFFI